MSLFSLLVFSIFFYCSFFNFHFAFSFPFLFFIFTSYCTWWQPQQTVISLPRFHSCVLKSSCLKPGALEVITVKESSTSVGSGIPRGWWNRLIYFFFSWKCTWVCLRWGQQSRCHKLKYRKNMSLTSAAAVDGSFITILPNIPLALF